MISFKNIHRYYDYSAYQRIKKVKYQQSLDRRSKKNRPKTYQDYLNKISGFKCCKPGQNCCYCLNGQDASGNNCLNPPAGQVCCDCSGASMYIA